jgi:hypothetical protein
MAMHYMQLLHIMHSHRANLYMSCDDLCVCMAVCDYANYIDKFFFYEAALHDLLVSILVRFLAHPSEH